jgi:hypothetical protein
MDYVKRNDMVSVDWIHVSRDPRKALVNSNEPAYSINVAELNSWASSGFSRTQLVIAYIKFVTRRSGS